MSSTTRAALACLVLLCACEHERRAEKLPLGSEPTDASTPSTLEPARATGDVATDAARTSTNGDPSTTRDAALPSMDAARHDGAAIGDAAQSEPEHERHDSFERALRIELGAPDTLVDEADAEQVDYFVFHAEAGAFYELLTTRGDFSPDVVISLYDAQRQLIAENDVGSLWPGDKIDARLVVRAASTGDYYLRVEDRLTPREFFTESRFALLYFYLRTRLLPVGTAGAQHEQDGAPNPVQFLKDERTGYSYVTLLGAFDSDPDVYTLDSANKSALIGHVSPPGNLGNGSTAREGVVQVATAAQQVVGAIDRARGQEYIHPPVLTGGYQLVVNPPADSGSNGFYSIDLVLLPDNPLELGEASNHTLEGAEVLALKGTRSRHALVLAELPEGDVDYFRFDATRPESIDVLCEGESGGSGVRGLKAELLDSAGKLLESASETATKNLHIERFPAPLDGTYYLKLSTLSSAPASAVEHWTRCGVIVEP